MADIERSAIEGLRRGEDRAYAAVIEELHAPIYRFLFRLSGDVGVAEDLTQETFLGVWQGIQSFQGKSRFGTWVFGIAYRQFLRWRDRRTPQTTSLDDERDNCETAAPVDQVIEQEGQRRVRAAVYSLPYPYREVVCLVHLEGLSYREAAEVLTVPVGTVKSRMNGAFKILRQKLGECGVRDDEMRQAEGLPGR